MRGTFTIDGLIYELSVSTDNHVTLAIVDGASTTYKPPYDPFDDWYQQPFITSDIEGQHYPLRVYRHALHRLCNWLGDCRPGYFTFSAHTEQRCRLYRRVATRLSWEFRYQWHEYEGMFYFYREQS